MLANELKRIILEYVFPMNKSNRKHIIVFTDQNDFQYMYDLYHIFFHIASFRYFICDNSTKLIDYSDII